MDWQPSAAACSCGCCCCCCRCLRLHRSASRARCHPALLAGGVRSVSSRGAGAAAVTVGRTMLARFSRRRLLSSYCRPCTDVDVRHSVICCCCCSSDVSTSSLLFAVTLCLSFVTSLTVVSDVTIPQTPGNDLSVRSRRVIVAYTKWNIKHKTIMQCAVCILVSILRTACDIYTLVLVLVCSQSYRWWNKA